MKQNPPKVPGKKEIRENVGSVLKLARDLGKSRALVSMWTRVPVHHVLAVERLTGWSRYEQRPDIYGPAPDTNSGRRAAILPKKPAKRKRARRV